MKQLNKKEKIKKIEKISLFVNKFSISIFVQCSLKEKYSL
jgi:hypothetical protein